MLSLQMAVSSCSVVMSHFKFTEPGSLSKTVPNCRWSSARFCGCSLFSRESMLWPGRCPNRWRRLHGWVAPAPSDCRLMFLFLSFSWTAHPKTFTVHTALTWVLGDIHMKFFSQTDEQLSRKWKDGQISPFVGRISRMHHEWKSCPGKIMFRGKVLHSEKM